MYKVRWALPTCSVFFCMFGLRFIIIINVIIYWALKHIQNTNLIKTKARDICLELKKFTKKL